MRLIPLIFMLAVLAGCQVYSYESPDGSRLSVSRMMTDAEFGELEAVAPNGTTLRITGLKSESEKIVEAAVRGAVGAAR